MQLSHVQSGLAGIGDLRRKILEEKYGNLVGCREVSNLYPLLVFTQIYMY